MDEKLREKFKKVAEAVRTIMVEPDVELLVCFEGVEKDEGCDKDLVPGYKPPYPYVKVVYRTGDGDVYEKKIDIGPELWDKSVEDIKKFVEFEIEQFMEEIDSVEYGGE
ncbi:MAG: hypothetical protein GXO03_03380 [Aquificae bacterium]|nr:hypothetical protein [Aquificota bacterium]